MDQTPSAIEPPLSPVIDHSVKTSSSQAVFAGLIAFIAIGLVVYSQTMGFVWDEGFHLLAAQLIDAGRNPYIDFCFPQTPLNAYWNAAWLELFGQSWRITHVLAALSVAGAVYLSADYVFRYFPAPRWRATLALVLACFVGLNNVVVQFGVVAQAYGICLLLIVAAFRLQVLAVARQRPWLAFAAGLLTGTAAGCSLLTAPVAPIFLLWLCFYNQSGSQRAKSLAFIAGSVLPFAPVVWLWTMAPRQVFFNILEYQALFRRVKWNGATPHDVDVLSAWLESAPALLIGFLAIGGLYFLVKTSNWVRARRAEFYLCSWTATGLTLYIATAHPTFQRYFLFVVPFAGILAIVGLYRVGSLLWSPDRPFLPAFLVATLVALHLGRSLFDDRNSTTWKDYEKIAAKIAAVTPPHGRIYADELVYFLLRRTPPFGMEFSYSHKLDLPPDQELLLHVVSERELNEQVKAGKFYTVQSCNDDRIDEMKLPELFPHKADVGDCSIFWGKVKGSTTGQN